MKLNTQKLKSIIIIIKIIIVIVIVIAIHRLPLRSMSLCLAMSLLLLFVNSDCIFNTHFQLTYFLFLLLNYKLTLLV